MTNNAIGVIMTAQTNLSAQQLMSWWLTRQALPQLVTLVKMALVMPQTNARVAN
jgi:hypothetical protein